MKLVSALFVVCACASSVFAAVESLSRKAGTANSESGTDSTRTISADNILSILEASGQVENLLLLSKSWHTTLHELNRSAIATVLSGSPVLSGLKLVDERVQLYTMLKNRPLVQPEHAFSLCSLILSQSWKSVDLEVRLIQEKHDGDLADQKHCFFVLFGRLVEQKRYEEAAYFIEKSKCITEECSLYCSRIFIYRLGKVSTSAQLSLLLLGIRNHPDHWFKETLSVILFTPVKDGIDILNPLLSLIEPFDNEGCYREVLEAVILSCIIELDEHAVEQCELIHLRNVRLIEWLESIIYDDSRIRASIPFARLLNDVRFGPSFISFQESEIKRCIQLRKENVSGEQYDDGYALLRASMLAQRCGFFQETLTWMLDSHYLRSVMGVLIRHQNFESGLSVDFCEKLLKQGFMTLKMFHVLCEAGRCPTVEEVQIINPYSQRLLILAKIGCSEEEFAAAVEEMFAQHANCVNSVMQTLMDKLENPIPFIATILRACNCSQQEDYKRQMSIWLGHEKNLRKFLEFGADAEFNALPDYKITLDIDTVHAILNDDAFATAICTCRDGFIRNRLYLPLHNLFYRGLCCEEVMRLFEILRVPLDEHPFSLQICDDDLSRKLCSLFSNGSALEDIAEYAKMPGFLAHLALFAYYIDSCSYAYVNAEMKSATPNLLQLRISLCILDKWRDTDLESFLRCAPNAVLRGFKLPERADQT